MPWSHQILTGSGVSPQHTETGEEVLRMCVAVRKKLQLYFWKDREFHELQVTSTVPSVQAGWELAL